MAWLVKGLGASLALLGMVLTAFPGLLVSVQEQRERFAAIEQRTRFGALSGLGLGLLLLEGPFVWPWALAFLGFWVTAGFVVSRGVGTLVDGYHPRQMLWIGVELCVAAALAYYLWGSD